MNLKKHITAAIAALVSLISASAQSTDYIDALKMYRDGDIPGATSALRKEIALHPDNDAAYYYLASLLQESRNPEEVETAERYFRKAAEIDPDNYWYKYMLALFYEETGRSELAAPLLEDLVERHPKKSSLYFDAARAYLRQNDIESALKWIDKIESAAGKSDMIACTRLDLMIHQDKGKEERAYGYLENYYKDFKSPRIASMLGEYQQKLFNDSTAIAYFNEALEMDNSYAAAYFGRAHSWQGLRKYDNYFADMGKFMANEEIAGATKADYIQHVMENPKFVAAFLPSVDSMVNTAREAHVADSTLNYVAGLYYFRTERKAKAAEILMQNMNFHPKSFSVGFQYLLLLYYAQSLEHTTEVATILLQRFPDHSEPLLIRGSAFRQLKQYESAIEDYEEYVSRAPGDSTTIVNGYPSLGDMYFECNQQQKAFSCYKKVLKVAPDNWLVLNNYAYYLSLTGKNLKTAKEMSGRCIKANPDNPTYLDTYAWILHLMGQDTEAKAIFKHAMLYGGKDEAPILDHYAEVLFSLGEYDMAFIYWNHAKSVDKEGTLKIEEKIQARKAERNSTR